MVLNIVKKVSKDRNRIDIEDNSKDYNNYEFCEYNQNNDSIDDLLFPKNLFNLKQSFNLNVFKNLFFIKAEFLNLVLKLLKNISAKNPLLNKTNKMDNINNKESGDLQNSYLDFIYFLKDLIIKYLKLLKSFCEKNFYEKCNYLENDYLLKKDSELNIYILRILDLFLISLDLNCSLINEIFLQNYQEIYLFIIIPFLKRDENINQIYINSPNEFFHDFIGDYIDNNQDSIKSKIYLLSKKLANLSNNYTNFIINLNLDILMFYILKAKIKRDKNDLIFQNKSNCEKEYPIKVNNNNSNSSDKLNYLKDTNFNKTFDEENLKKIITYENMIKLITRYNEFKDNPIPLEIEFKHLIIKENNNHIKIEKKESNYLLNLNDILNFYFPGLRFNYINGFSSYYHILYNKLNPSNYIEADTKNLENSIFVRIFETFIEDKTSKEKTNRKIYLNLDLTDIIEIIILGLASIMDPLFMLKSIFIKFNLVLRCIFKELEKFFNSKDELLNINFCMLLFSILKKELPFDISSLDIEEKNYSNENYLKTYLDFIIKIFNQNKISNKTNSNTKNQLLIHFIDNLFFPEIYLNLNLKEVMKDRKILNSSNNDNYNKSLNIFRDESKSDLLKINGDKDDNRIIDYKMEDFDKFMDVNENKFCEEESKKNLNNNSSRNNDVKSLLNKNFSREDLFSDENENLKNKMKNKDEEMQIYSSEDRKIILHSNSDLRKFLKNVFFEKNDFLLNIYNNHLKLKDNFTFSTSFNSFLTNLIRYGYHLIDNNIFILTKYFLSEIIKDIQQKISTKSCLNKNLLKNSFINKYKLKLNQSEKNNNFNYSNSNYNTLEKKDFSYSNIIFLEEICIRMTNHQNKIEKRNFFSNIHDLILLCPKIISINYPYEDKIFEIINIYISYMLSYFETFNLGNFTLKQIKSFLSKVDEFYGVFKEIQDSIENGDFHNFQIYHTKCFTKFFKLFNSLNDKINFLNIFKRELAYDEDVNFDMSNNSNLDNDSKDFYFSDNRKNIFPKSVESYKTDNNSNDNEMEIEKIDLNYMKKEKNDKINLENKNTFNNLENNDEIFKEEKMYIINNNETCFLNLFKNNYLKEDILINSSYNLFFHFINVCMNNSSDSPFHILSNAQDPFIKSEINSFALISLITNLIEYWKILDLEKINSICELVICLIQNKKKNLKQEYMNKLYLLCNLIILKLFSLFSNDNSNDLNNDEKSNSNNFCKSPFKSSNRFNYKKENLNKRLLLKLKNGNGENTISISLFEYLDKIDIIVKFILNSEAFGFYMENIISFYSTVNLFDLFLDELEICIKEDNNSLSSFSHILEGDLFNSNLNLRKTFNEVEGMNLIQSKVLIVISIYQFLVERLNIIKITANVEKKISGFLKDENISFNSNNKGKNYYQFFNKNLKDKNIYSSNDLKYQSYIDIFNSLNQKFENLKINLNMKRQKNQTDIIELQKIKNNNYEEYIYSIFYYENCINYLNFIFQILNLKLQYVFNLGGKNKCSPFMQNQTRFSNEEIFLKNFSVKANEEFNLNSSYSDYEDSEEENMKNKMVNSHFLEENDSELSSDDYNKSPKASNFIENSNTKELKKKNLNTE